MRYHREVQKKRNIKNTVYSAKENKCHQDSYIEIKKT